MVQESRGRSLPTWGFPCQALWQKECKDICDNDNSDICLCSMEVLSTLYLWTRTSQQSYEIRESFTLRKLRHRDGKWLANSRTASEWHKLVRLDLPHTRPLPLRRWPGCDHSYSHAQELWLWVSWALGWPGPAPWVPVFSLHPGHGDCHSCDITRKWQIVMTLPKEGKGLIAKRRQICEVGAAGQTSLITEVAATPGAPRSLRSWGAEGCKGLHLTSQARGWALSCALHTAFLAQKAQEMPTVLVSLFLGFFPLYLSPSEIISFMCYLIIHHLFPPLDC